MATNHSLYFNRHFWNTNFCQIEAAHQSANCHANGLWGMGWRRRRRAVVWYRHLVSDLNLMWIRDLRVTGQRYCLQSFAIVIAILGLNFFQGRFDCFRASASSHNNLKICIWASACKNYLRITTTQHALQISRFDCHHQAKLLQFWTCETQLNCLYRKFTLFRVHWGRCTYFAAPRCREHSMSNAWASNVVLKFDCCHAAAAVILMLALHAHLSREVAIACVTGCEFA